MPKSGLEDTIRKALNCFYESGFFDPTTTDEKALIEQITKELPQTGITRGDFANIGQFACFLLQFAAVVLMSEEAEEKIIKFVYMELAKFIGDLKEKRAKKS